MRFDRFIYLPILFLFFSTVAWCAKISGRVTYPNGAPVTQVRVQLRSDMIAFQTETNTDLQGKFVFEGIPMSTFHIWIELIGYETWQRNVDISMSGMSYEDAVLRPKPGTEAPRPSSATLDARIAAIPPEAKKEFDAGEKAMAGNDLPGAAQHFQKAITLYPKYAEAYQLLGVMQLQSAQKAEDLKAVETSEMKAIEIEKNLPNAYYILGVARANLGNTPAAEEPLTTFVAKDPANPDGHFELAKTEFALNKFPDAELHARKAIELKEKNPGVQVVLAYSLLRQKKGPEARDAFKQYLKLDPNSPMKADVEKTIAMIDEHEKQAK